MTCLLPIDHRAVRRINLMRNNKNGRCRDLASLFYFNTGKDDTSLITGVELEINGYSSKSDANCKDELFSEIMPVNWTYGGDCTTEGDWGTEMRSVPTTIDYWKQCRYDLENLFNLLINNGFYSGDNCGIHIHIDIANIDDNHIFKMSTFVNYNWDFVAGLIGKRCTDNYNSPVDNEIPDIGNMKRYGHGTAFAYRESTVEFRCFASTLDVEQFLLNLEAVEAIHDYTLEENMPEHMEMKNRASRVSNFKRWISANSEKYERLAKELS